jgi:hypothetical protein
MLTRSRFGGRFEAISRNKWDQRVFRITETVSTVSNENPSNYLIVEALADK